MPKANYIIYYGNGDTDTFYAATPEDAAWYFYMEGDHAMDYGRIQQDEPE